MKLKLPLLSFALLATAFQCGLGQEEAPSSTLKVTTSLNKDGTKTVVQTNSEDHTAETTIYDAQNRMIQKTIFKVGDMGVPDGGSVYVVRGTGAQGQPRLVLVYTMVYKRDGLNRLSEVQNYSPANQLLSRQVYHYDASNRVVKIDNYDAQGNPIGDASQARPDKKK